VTVPYSGWYGFCFGTNDSYTFESWDGGVNNNGDDDDNESPSLYRRIVLRVHPPHKQQKPAATTTTTATDEEMTQSICHGLPLLWEGKQLLDLQVGRLLYLPRGSRVEVVRREVGPVNSPPPTTSSTTISSSGCSDDNNFLDEENVYNESSALYRWMLVCHRMTDRVENNGGTAVHAAATATASLGQQRKGLVCAKCAKSFGTLRAVETHIRTVHQQTSWLDRSASAEFVKLWTTPLAVIYQDDYVAVVDKPQGMPVLGTKRCLYRSDLLLALSNVKYVGRNRVRNTATVNAKKRTRSSDENDRHPTAEDGGSECTSDGRGKSVSGGNAAATAELLASSLPKPRPVHRLDAPTGGLLVVAKTAEAERRLKMSWAEHKCRKTYLALVVGAVQSDSGTCDTPLSGKAAVTHYTRQRIVKSKTWGELTVLELKPVTGRTHQLRRHTQLLGHPILGDSRYHRETREYFRGGNPKENHPYSKLCLWATEVSFPHPETGERITCRLDDEPEWLSFVIRYEEQQWTS